MTDNQDPDSRGGPHGEVIPLSCVTSVPSIAPSPICVSSPDAGPLSRHGLWRSAVGHLVTAARILAFRRLPGNALTGHAAAVAIVVAISLAIDAVTGWLIIGRVAPLRAWGISSFLAFVALQAGVLMLARGRKTTFEVGAAMSVAVSIGIWLTLLWSVVIVASSPGRMPAPAWVLAWLPFVTQTVIFVWYLVALAVLGASAMRPRRWRGAFGFVVSGLAALLLLPNTPIVITPYNMGSEGLMSAALDAIDWTRAPRGEAETAAAPIDFEATWARQPGLVDAALAALLPSRKDRSEFYFVSVGAYAEQDVFLREATTARQIFDERMQTWGRSVLLANNRRTVDDLPLANATNLAAVMDRLSEVMDQDKDVLVLFVTSHGSQTRLSVSFAGFPFNDLTPERLSQVLARSRIRHRVVVLSACHAGAFIPAIEDRDTLVITAARADRTSFGCSNEREWTYFGDAYFNHALRRTRNLVDAFDLARATVGEWETREKLEASEPQMAGGEGIRRKLVEIARVLDDNGPAVAADAPGPAGPPSGAPGAPAEAR